MKEFIIKVFVYSLVLTLGFPILGLIGLLVICKNYIWSLIISCGLFFLILGFSGVSCFLAVALTLILSYVGDLVYKKFLEAVEKGMDKKLNELTPGEKSQRKRGIGIDDILGKLGGVN